MPVSGDTEAIDTRRLLPMPVSPFVTTVLFTPHLTKGMMGSYQACGAEDRHCLADFTENRLVGVSISHAPHAHIDTNVCLSRAEMRDVILCNPISGDDKPHGPLRISGREWWC